MKNRILCIFLGILLSIFSKAELVQAALDPIDSITNAWNPFGNGLFDRYFNDPSLTAVTREFGPSVIPMGKVPYRSKVIEAYQKPWSSWWYPKKDDFLFKDPNSTLAKYDVVRRKRYHDRGLPMPRSAVDYEREHYNARVLPWEGLCDAWSLAGIMMPEPKRPVTIDLGYKLVTFSVADLKALLLKTFEAVDDSHLKYYGQKFTGGPDGWIFPDIFPNEFHRFIEMYLFEKKQAFIMDHDPGPEMWNVPVYKANYKVDLIDDDPNAVKVTAWIYSAEVVLSHQKDAVGTREAIRTYHYILRGTRTEEGNLVVTSGDWTVGPDGIDSRKNHPDFITTIINPISLVRKSANPEIEVSLVDEILQKSY